MEPVILAILILSFFIQIFYIVRIFAKLAFYNTAIAKKSTTQAGVSVLIVAKNELENLKVLIPKLLTQDYANFEILVADDGSRDESRLYLVAQSLENPQLKLIPIDNVPPHVNSKKYALTLSIKSAKYETILLTDADCIPQSNNWIAHMQELMVDNKEIVLGVSFYKKEKSFLNSFIQYETFYTAMQYLSFALIGKPYMGVGRNLAYKKDIFFKNKGFHKHVDLVGGDDDLFVNRVATPENVQICIEKDAQTLSIPKNTWKNWFRQKRRHLYIGKYYKSRHKWMLGLLHTSQMIFWGALIAYISWLFPFKNIQWTPEIFTVIGIFTIRLLSLLFIFKKAARKLSIDIGIFSIIFFDFIFIMYFFVLGGVSFFTKKVRWS